MATSNFKVFNESMSNMESDAQYSNDTQRINGVVPGMASSILHNKLFRQTSIMAAAIGQLAANRGYNANDTDLAALVQSLNGALGPAQTTGNLTLYVSQSAGDDSKDGLSTATSLKTIQAAVNKIPTVSNHEVKINVADGTYSEIIDLRNKIGGNIYLIGNPTNPNNVILVGKFMFYELGSYVEINGFKITPPTNNNAVYIDLSKHIKISNIIIPSTSGYDGMIISGTNGFVENCTINNSGGAISVVNGNVVSSNNSGSGNVYGLYCSNAGKIGKSGSQPNGTTAEYTVTGGEIL